MADDDLASRASKGDASAVGELVRRNYDSVYRYARSITGDADAAVEATQETFFRVVRAISKYRETGRFKRWLFKIAANCARDQLLRRAGARALSEDARLAVPADDWDILETEGLESAVRAAVENLPVELRQVVVLRHETGLKFREIAEVLGIPLGTTLSRMRRAVELLRPALEEYKPEKRRKGPFFVHSNP